MNRDLVISRTYNHPPERVWFALTDSDALAAWLMKNNFEARVGHRFQMLTEPRPGFDGVVNCTVLEVDPPRKLSFTWVGGPLDTVLTFTLEPVPEGTRLHVRQSGFSGFKALLVSMILQRGWKSLMSTRLLSVLDAVGSGAWPPNSSSAAPRT